jgi:Secretion system C-terminal sorting domain
LSLTSSEYTLGISKYTVDGSFLWAKSIQCNDPNSLGLSTNDFQFFIDSNNSIILCGDFSGMYDFDTSIIEDNTLSSSFETETNQYLSNIYIAKYNSNGELISANTLEGFNQARLSSAIYTNNQELLICGTYTGMVDFDLSSNSQIMPSSSTYYNDRFFAKYHFNTLNSEENNFGNNITVYPNPTANYLNIHNPFFNEMDVKIIDLTGKLLFEGKIYNNATIDVSNYQYGAYIIELNDAVNNTKNISKFIKK